MIDEKKLIEEIKSKYCDSDFMDSGVIQLFVDMINNQPQVDKWIPCEDKKPMTNAERIRNMSAEELAIIIMCPYDGTKEGDCFMEGRNCIQCCKEWLQAEVEEGATDE